MMHVDNNTYIGQCTGVHRLVPPRLRMRLGCEAAGTSAGMTVMEPSPDSGTACAAGSFTLKRIIGGYRQHADTSHPGHWESIQHQSTYKQAGRKEYVVTVGSAAVELPGLHRYSSMS